jgi:hypothetical protein
MDGRKMRGKANCQEWKDGKGYLMLEKNMELNLG